MGCSRGWGGGRRGREQEGEAKEEGKDEEEKDEGGGGGGGGALVPLPSAPAEDQGSDGGAVKRDAQGGSRSPPATDIGVSGLRQGYGAN